MTPVVPYTLSVEMEKWYLADVGSTNAADQYLAAVAEMSAASLPTIVFPSGAAAMAPATVTWQVQAVVNDNAEAIQMLAAAAKVKPCRYPYHFEGYKTLLPNIAKVAQASKVLRFRTYLLIRVRSRVGCRSGADRSVVRGRIPE